MSEYNDPGPRFWSKVAIATGDECWIWIAGKTNAGYGQYHIGMAGKNRSKMGLAHRISFEAIRGQVPEGLDLDHLCRNRDCVNPDHLEPVTRGENVRRGIKGVLTTHCPQGHEYSHQNTHINKHGHRLCRTCNREKQRIRLKAVYAARVQSQRQSPS